MRKCVLSLLLGVLLSALFSTVASAATVSGSINNLSGKSGRAYILLANYSFPVPGQPPPPESFTGYGTSIPDGATTYTISGVRNGMYKVKVFIDTYNPPRGLATAASPVGSSDGMSPVIVEGDDVTVPPVAVNNQAPLEGRTIPPPARINVYPFDGHVLVEWEGTFQNGIEQAEGYNLYYSTGATFNSAAATLVNSGAPISNRGNNDGYNWLIPLSNGSTYSFAVKAVWGNGVQSTAVVKENVTVGAPAGPYTLSGTVNFSGFIPNAPLYVVAMRMKDYKNFIVKIPSPSVNQAFTISGLDKGTYEVGCVYDKNGDGTIHRGDLESFETSQRRMVTITNANVTIPDIALVQANAIGVVNTFTGQDGYYLHFAFRSQEKQLANVVLNANAQAGLQQTGLSYNDWGEINYFAAEVPKPAVGDQYGATLTFTDGTTQAVTMAVTGVVDAVPDLHFPYGTISGSGKQSPNFSWGISGMPQGDMQYQVSVYDNSITNGENTVWSAVVPADKLSVSYDQAFSATGLPLAIGGSGYSWGVQIVDRYGNSAGSQSSPFYVGANPETGPVISTVSPLSGAPGSTVTITGSGFVAGNLSANVVKFNDSAPAAVTSASATQLVVTVPDGAFFGPVMVTANGKTTASAQEFEPLLSYDFFVTQGDSPSGCINQIGLTNSCSPASGVVATIDSLTATTGGNGNFKIGNIKGGKTFNAKFAGTGYASVVSSRTALFRNFSSAGSYSMFTPTQVANWGGTAGKEAVVGVVTGKSGAISGAEVRAFNARTGMMIAASNLRYTNPANPSGPPVAGTTHTDGRFWVLNVDGGDTIIVTAVKAGYVFSINTFDVEADSVNEGLITGTPVPVITSFTSAFPGASMTITGANFDPDPQNNIVTFYYGQVATVVSGSTTHLVVTVPQNVDPGPVSVAIAGVRGARGVSSASYWKPSDPVVTSISPQTGVAGTSVSLMGTFADVTKANYQIRVAGNPATISTVTGTSLVFTLPAGLSGDVEMTYSGKTYNVGYFTYRYKLTVNITGSGSVNGSYSCASASCTGDFNYNDPLTLMASPSTGYQFLGWSGAGCSGTGTCLITMSGDKVVSAPFQMLQLVKIGSVAYPKLQDAFTAVLAGETILARGQEFIENLIFSKAGAVKFRGGFDETFTTNLGVTKVDGSMKLRGGTLRVEKLAIK